MPEGVRPFVLVEHVDGAKPAPPFDDDLYRSVGALLGRLHEVADGFRSDHPRRPGPYGDLSAALGRIRSALGGQPEVRRSLTALGGRASAFLEDQESRLERGVLHGDVTMDNVIVTPAGPVIYDFDLAQLGWRIADLSGCLATPFAEAFLAGYTSVRPVGEDDLAALPWLRVVEVVRNLDFHLNLKPLWLGRESIGEGWVDRDLAELAAAAERLH